LGYRSEVKSLIYGTKEQMAKFNNDNKELLDALADDFGTEISYEKNADHEIIYLDSAYCKWYESYADVIRWNNLLTLAQDADLATEFVRIGEDSEGDIESDFTGDCMPYLETECHIVANF
jgi:hypothetical protein